MSSTIVETETLRGIATHVSAGIDDKAVITVGYKPIATVGAAMKKQTTVNVGLIYTTTVSDDLEMWWCDQWRMLWNKNLKVLWSEESV